MLGSDVLEWNLHGCGKTCRVHTAGCLWKGSSTSSAGRGAWLPTAATLEDAGQNAEPQMPLWMVWAGLHTPVQVLSLEWLVGLWELLMGAGIC